VDWIFNDRNSLKRLAEAPVPPLHRQLLHALQAKLGCGIAPVFPDIGDSANMSTLVGGSTAAAALKWQLVQGSTCRAPTMSAQDVRNMLPLVVYQHSVWDARAPLARHWHSNLLAHLLRDLDAAAPGFTWAMTGGSWPFHMLRFKHTPP
jgi:hypothetical protein